MSSASAMPAATPLDVSALLAGRQRILVTGGASDLTTGSCCLGTSSPCAAEFSWLAAAAL